MPLDDLVMSRRGFGRVAVASAVLAGCGSSKRPKGNKTGQRFKDLDFPIKDEQTRVDVIDLIGSRQTALKLGILNPILVGVEVLLDLHPGQREVVNYGLARGNCFELSDGLVYNGIDNFDQVLLDGHAKGELFFTRAAHEWAIGFFNANSSSPAISALGTPYFNDLVKKGHARLYYTLGVNRIGDRGYTFLDIFPKSSGFSLDKTEENWVSEETYARYQRIAYATNPADLPEQDKLLMAVQPRLRKLLETEHIKKIPELRHTELPCAHREEMVLSYTFAHGIVGTYMHSRGLFQHIPFIRIEGEEDPFKGFDTKEFVSQGLAARAERYKPQFEDYKQQLRQYIESQANNGNHTQDYFLLRS